MRRIQVTKIEDIPSKKQGTVLPVGKKKRGVEYTRPTLGCVYTLYPLDIDKELRKEDDYGIETTPVEEVIDEFTFKTSNSTYKIEEIPQL